MPPASRELYQEGAAIKSFKLVENGRFNLEGITKILFEEPAQYKGCSGTRCLEDNISDLKGLYLQNMNFILYIILAQVAANQKGIVLVKSLIQEYGIHIPLFYIFI